MELAYIVIGVSTFVGLFESEQIYCLSLHYDLYYDIFTLQMDFLRPMMISLF